MKLLITVSMAFAISAAAQNVMLMNCIGPSGSDLYVANPDGSGEHRLLPVPGFDYHATYSQDGKWIVFTSERTGYGQADLYRVHPDGTGLERLTDDPALDDQGALSPEDSTLAFVSTRATHRANVWLLDLHTKRFRNLTGTPEIQADPQKPDGFFRPAWSPDGKWIAFSSDRNTEWRGHNHNAGWEHMIVSIDLATGKRTEQTSGPGLKLAPQFLPDGRIGFETKAGRTSGIEYTKGTGTFPANLRSPAWSPDGKQVIYEKVDDTPRPQNQLLYSWDPKYEYRYTDVFPSFLKDGTLLVTNKDVNSSIVTMDADGGNKHQVFKSSAPCNGTPAGPCGAMDGVAFGPSWSPDGQSIVFGFGGHLQIRGHAIAKIMTVHRDGSDVKDLTSGNPNAPAPSEMRPSVGPARYPT